MISVVHYWNGSPQVANAKWDHVFRLLKACAAQGWRTCLVWSRLPDDPSLSRPFRDIGCEIALLPRPAGNFSLSCIRDAYRLLRRVNCTILHCHNVHTSPLIAAALARTPVRIWSNQAMSPYYEQGHRARGIHRFRPSVRVSCALSTRVLCISSAVRDELRDLGLNTARFLVQPWGIDTSAYSAASEDGLRAELGIGQDASIVTAVGHAVPVKGWDVLIRAFAVVAARMSQCRLLLVGGLDGPTERETAASLKSTVHDLGLDGRVRFLGRRNDIPRILAASDVFAFPSRSEGQGMALLEAMATGLPCVAARVGGIPETLAHDRNGLLFEREDAQDLSGKLWMLLSDRALRQRLSQAARRDVQAYSLEKVNERVLGLYRMLLEGAPVSGRIENPAVSENV